MLYQKANIKNSQVVIVESKEIDQNKLTSDCWLVQFNGLAACKDCEYHNTDNCGGGETLRKLKE